MKDHDIACCRTVTVAETCVHAGIRYTSPYSHKSICDLPMRGKKSRQHIHCSFDWFWTFCRTEPRTESEQSVAAGPRSPIRITLNSAALHTINPSPPTREGSPLQTRNIEARPSASGARRRRSYTRGSEPGGREPTGPLVKDVITHTNQIPRAHLAACGVFSGSWCAVLASQRAFVSMWAAA